MAQNRRGRASAESVAGALRQTAEKTTSSCLSATFHLSPAGFRLTDANAPFTAQLKQSLLPLPAAQSDRAVWQRCFDTPFGRALRPHLKDVARHARPVMLDEPFFYGWIFATEITRSDVSEIRLIAISNAQTKAASATETQARLQARLAERSKSEFLSNMSHELRTPLNAIIGFSDIMQSEMFGPLGNPRYADYVKNIADCASGLLQDINDVLEIANLDLNLTELRERPIDLQELLLDLAYATEMRAIKSGLTFRKFFPPTPLPMRADGPRLRQALQHILSNALKYNTPKGHIDFSCQVQGGGITIAVRDTGCGIPSACLQQVTEAFARPGDCYSRASGGIGLGLAIAQHYTAMHGGRLAIESTEGKGTTVTITLPAARLLSENTPPAQSLARRTLTNA